MKKVAFLVCKRVVNYIPCPVHFIQPRFSYASLLRLFACSFYNVFLEVIIDKCDEPVTGAFKAYKDNGELLSEKSATIDFFERKALIVGNEFSNPEDIRYIIFSSNSSGVCGYTKFYREGVYRAAIPAVQVINASISWENIYIPHIDTSDKWWTGIQAYNPGSATASVTVTPYTEGGISLSSFNIDDIQVGSKYVEMVRSTDLPEETAWFKIDSTQPLIGFELFGTWDGRQLAGYSTVGIKRRAGVFPKLEPEGWNGVHFVNPTNTSATVTLSIYDDDGYMIKSQVIVLDGHQKVVDHPENIFSGPITAGTYLRFSSDKDVVGFQLNCSSDGMMLDGLPGM